MIPGKLYHSVTYSTKVWGSIEYDEGKHYLSDFLINMRSETVFMVIESMKDNDNFYSFSKILDANGNIGYIRYNDGFSARFKEVRE